MTAVAAIDSSVKARIARLGTVYDRLLNLTGGERAYRAAGDQATATALAAERLDILTELTRGEAEEILLVAIGRAAPALRLCGVCRRKVADTETCQACQDVAGVDADANWWRARQDNYAHQRTSHPAGHNCPACTAARAEFDAMEVR